MLLLNAVVFPGLGTLASGQNEHRKTGRLQIAGGIVVVLILLVAQVVAMVVYGKSPEEVMSLAKYFYFVFFALFLWSCLTGLLLVRKAIRQSKHDGQS
jgi:hypothetical protein